MAPPAVDLYCRRFQPNTFDPSRCSTCLRPDHMHLTTTSTYDTRQPSPPTHAVTEEEQEEEGGDDYDDDDDDALSEVTTCDSSDGVSWTYDWNLVHSLSPEWEHNICDTDIQTSSPNQWDCPGLSRSLSSERDCVAQKDMTRLDPSPQRGTEGSWMDERRPRDRSRRPSRQSHESRGFREQESGYFSPDRKGDGERQTEGVNKRPFHYYERGHALPSNYVLEPKACVPYRNVNLGVPSQRRNVETYMQEVWRSESPQRYTYHSNFRPGIDSPRNSPTRHSSVSPDRHKYPESPAGPQRGSSLCRSAARSHASSQHPSHAPSRHTSGRSSPSRRRRSITSRAGSPSRITPSHRSRDSLHLQNGDYGSQRGFSRESRSPSQTTAKHSLDSEKLYRNLEFISRRGSSVAQKNSYEGSQPSPRTRTSANSSANTRTRNSREVSPSRNAYGTHSPRPPREAPSRDSRLSPSQGSWQGSAHSILSLPQSHGSRRGVDYQMLDNSGSHDAIAETDKGLEGNNKVSADRSRSNVRRGMEALLISEPKKETVETQEPVMTIDDYIVLAGIPTIQLESEEEVVGLRRRNQSPSPCRDPRIRSYREQDVIDTYSPRPEADERGRVRERGRDRREKCRDPENGRLSRRPSTASHQSSESHRGKHRSTMQKEQALPEHLQTQWRKHWFVLGDTSLRYYRDSEAEETDDVDGEIDLTSCVNVCECDVQKNYGLQIKTKRAVFTLSAVTSRIRQNWVKLLKQVIQNNTHQSDSGVAKEYPLSRRPSSCQPLSRFTCRDSGYEPATSTFGGTTATANSHQAEHRRHQSVDPSPASQRGEGEGWDREQAKRLEERNRWFERGVPFSEMGSRWDSMELKKGSVPVPVIESLDTEVSRKWTEFETLSFRDMSPQSLIGAQAYQSSTTQAPESPVTAHTYESGPEEAPLSHTLGSQEDLISSRETPSAENGFQTIQNNTAEALQMEALSLRERVESIKKERASVEMEVDSPCGPRAPCRARLEAMEAAHRKTLQELKEQHRREVAELEKQRDAMLQEDRQAAASAMEALRTAHREELQRDVEKAKGSTAGATHEDTSHRGHILQADILHSELDVLSESFSQKCLELNRTEQSSRTRESELHLKEREMEQLRRENQELKAKLAEEISRMRHFITGQRLDSAACGGAERTQSELEMLLRAKENEVQYLKSEIGCLQNEVQSLTKEKEAAYEQYKEAYVELNEMKGRSQLERSSLNEHLRLAKSALQEGARQTKPT